MNPGSRAGVWFSKGSDPVANPRQLSYLALLLIGGYVAIKTVFECGPLLNEGDSMGCSLQVAVNTWEFVGSVGAALLGAALGMWYSARHSGRHGG